MSLPTKKITYNPPQLQFVVSQRFSGAKDFVLEWGRGTGKSTIIGKHLYDCVCELPRSTGAIVGQTYKQIKTRTLPSTIKGLAEHGVVMGKHYFVGRRAPQSWNWPEPYQPILEPDNCIFWWNGAVTVLLSLDSNASSSRGLNLDYAIGDEAATFDEEKFNTDVKLCIRGNKNSIADYPDGSWQYYEQSRMHHTLLLATSTPLTSSGKWIFKYEEAAKADPTKTQYFRASALYNIVNLGKDFFKKCKATMAAFLYEAEVLNRRITQVIDGFYPKFNAHTHTYESYNHNYYRELTEGTAATCEGDGDLDYSLPLHIGIDWGANINSMAVAQRHPNELRFLKNFYVLSPQIIDDLIEHQFIPYYTPYLAHNKTVYFYYDASGNNSQANSRITFAEQVMQLLRNAGFLVIPMTRGNYNESHEVKFALWAQLLMEHKPDFPRIRFNRSNCKELIISIEMAPAKKGERAAIQKNKKSERNKNLAQQHATHLSDAADLIVVGNYRNLYNNTYMQIDTQIR